MHGLEPADRLDEGVQRALGLACGEPLRGDLAARLAPRLEQLGELPVQLPAAVPGHVVVQRLAHERMAERRPPLTALDHQPADEQRVQPRGPAQRRDRVEVEARAGDGRRLRGRPGLGRERRDPQQHRVADRLRERHVVVAGDVGPARPGCRRPCASSTDATSSTKNGTPCVRR